MVIDKTVKNKQKSRKGILCFVGICICVLLIFIAKYKHTPYDSKITLENKYERVANEFINYLNNGDYENAEKLIDFPYVVNGSFKNFAKENLKNCEFEEISGGYILVSGKNSYKLKYNDSSDQFYSDDFIMEYNVKYSSYLSSSKNSFEDGEKEVLEDGMTLYTKKIYKTHEITLQCDVILGEPEGLVPQIQIQVQTDEDYKVCEITEARDYLNSSETYDGADLEEDGTIVIDSYYISEDYSGKIARIYSDYLTDMANAILSGEDFNSFSSRYSNYIFATDAQREAYEALYSNQSMLGKYIDRIEAEPERWEYPKEFRYSEGEYIIKETVSMKSYQNDRVIKSSTDSNYVLFKAGKEGFKIYSESYKQEDL